MQSVRPRIDFERIGYPFYGKPSRKRDSKVVSLKSLGDVEHLIVFNMKSQISDLRSAMPFHSVPSTPCSASMFHPCHPWLKTSSFVRIRSIRGLMLSPLFVPSVLAIKEGLFSRLCRTISIPHPNSDIVARASFSGLWFCRTPAWPRWASSIRSKSFVNTRSSASASCSGESGGTSKPPPVDSTS